MSINQILLLNQKFIHSIQQSQNSILFNAKSISKSCLSFTKEELAQIRFSKEYLSLLPYNQKVFSKTYNSLKFFYTQKEGKRTLKNCLEQNFQNYIFQSIFTQNQKNQIEKLIKKQFNCDKQQKKKKKSQKINPKQNLTLSILNQIIRFQQKKNNNQNYQNLQ